MDKRERKSIARNRSARHEYEILETFECGVVLTVAKAFDLRTRQHYAAFKRLQYFIFVTSRTIVRNALALTLVHRPAPFAALPQTFPLGQELALPQTFRHSAHPASQGSVPHRAQAPKEPKQPAPPQDREREWSTEWLHCDCPLPLHLGRTSKGRPQSPHWLHRASPPPREDRLLQNPTAYPDRSQYL